MFVTYLFINNLHCSGETEALVDGSGDISKPIEDLSDPKVMSVSKELSAEKAEIEKRVLDEGSITSIFFSAAKKIAAVGVVYFVGYMGWSVAWLICPVLLSVIRDQFRKQHDVRRSVAKASALASDKEVILARLDDLPAWVRKI